MRVKALHLTLAILIAVMCCGRGFAHHSVSAEFDHNKSMTLAGTITKVEWTNPHAFFYVDVKDPKTGATVNWICELPSPKALAVRSWTPDSLKVGMTVSLNGTLARDGSRKVYTQSITTNGGHALCATGC
jgi:Family of unknown function (DUF6152)